MSELRQILALWRRAQAAGEEVCLATVVGIEGSAYRKPGARMLLTSGGQRAGTVSGGCLEAEVAKKAWWLTRAGAAVERYSTFFDDDSPMPYGLGCGGTIRVLLERGRGAEAVLGALEQCVEQRRPAGLLASLEKTTAGTRLLVQDRGVVFEQDAAAGMQTLAMQALATRRPGAVESTDKGELYVECLRPPQALHIFGAGDDARPLTEIAHTLGWETTVVDGRPQLATRERFPLASRVRVAAAGDADTRSGIASEPEDAAVLMTHSFEQDAGWLAALLARPMAYIGVLGPRRRTERLLQELVQRGTLAESEIDACMRRLHAPVGLNLGSASPAQIALAIAAEIQQTVSQNAIMTVPDTAAPGRPATPIS